MSVPSSIDPHANHAMLRELVHRLTPHSPHAFERPAFGRTRSRAARLAARLASAVTGRLPVAVRAAALGAVAAALIGVAALLPGLAAVYAASALPTSTPVVLAVWAGAAAGTVLLPAVAVRAAARLAELAP